MRMPRSAGSWTSSRRAVTWRTRSSWCCPTMVPARRGTSNEPNAWLGQAESVSEALAHLDELGGHRSFSHYPWGWAWAGNTPLQLWKRYAWLGGVRTPLVVLWPGHLAAPGAVRSQFCHAIDLCS